MKENRLVVKIIYMVIISTSRVLGGLSLWVIIHGGWSMDGCY